MTNHNNSQYNEDPAIEGPSTHANRCQTSAGGAAVGISYEYTEPQNTPTIRSSDCDGEQ